MIKTIAKTKLALIVGAALVATAGLTAATGALSPRSIWGGDNPGQGVNHASMPPAGEEHNRAGLNHTDNRSGGGTGGHGDDDNETDDHGNDDNQTADNETDDHGSHGGHDNGTADDDNETSDNETSDNETSDNDTADNETQDAADAGTPETLTADNHVAKANEPMVAPKA